MSVPLELWSEDAQRACDQRDRAVWVMACATPGDLRQAAAEQSRILAVPVSTDEVFEIAGDGGESVHTRPALPRALAGEVAGDACGLCDTASALRQRHERARAGIGGPFADSLPGRTFTFRPGRPAPAASYCHSPGTRARLP